MKEYGLSEYDTTILTDEAETAGYFERCIKEGLKNTSGVAGKLGLPRGGETITPKTIANWIINKKADITNTSPEELNKLVVNQTQKVAISDEELEKIIKKVLAENPKAVANYKSGKENALMFLLGQVMRETKGKAYAEKIKQKLKVLLK